MYFISELFTNIKKSFRSKNEVLNVPIDRQEAATVALDSSKFKFPREIAKYHPRLPSDVDKSIFKLSIVEIRILICLISYDCEHENMVVFDSADREIISTNIIARDVLMNTLKKIKEKGFIETVENKEISGKKHFRYFLSKKTYENIDYIVLLIAYSKIIKPDRHSKVITENLDLMKITFNQGSVYNFNLSFVLSLLYLFARCKPELQSGGSSIYCGDVLLGENSKILGINYQTFKRSLKKLKTARFINYRTCRHAETLHMGYSVSICFPTYSALEDISNKIKNCHFLPKTCLKKAKEAENSVASFKVQSAEVKATKPKIRKEKTFAENFVPQDNLLSEYQMIILKYLHEQAIKRGDDMLVDVNCSQVARELGLKPSTVNHAATIMCKRGIFERITLKGRGLRFITYKVVVHPEHCVSTRFWGN